MRIGERIAHYRHRRGLSQAELAGHLGRTPAWLAMLEGGARPVDRWATLIKIAAVLQVHVRDLVGQPFLLELAADGRRGGTRAVRDALLRSRVTAGSLDTPDRGQPRELPHLRARVTLAWRLWQAARYAELGAALPVLLEDVRLATDRSAGDDRRAASGLLAESCQIIAGLLTRLGETDLAWVATERAIAAAEHADDPLLTTAGVWHLTGVLLGSGRPREATDVALAAADRVTAEDADAPERLSLLGALLLDAAIATAVLDDRAGVGELLGRAAAVARRLGADRNDLWTLFGPTAVAIQAVTVAVELGDGTIALERARAVDPAPLPSLARRARHAIDVARAHTQTGRDAAAAASLLQAGRLAPEEVRYQPLAHELLRYLLRRQHPILPAELRALAEQVGVLG